MATLVREKRREGAIGLGKERGGGKEKIKIIINHCHSITEYDALVRMGIESPQTYIKMHYKDKNNDLLMLKTCCIGPSVISEIEAHVEDTVITQSQWIDIMVRIKINIAEAAFYQAFIILFAYYLFQNYPLDNKLCIDTIIIIAKMTYFIFPVSPFSLLLVLMKMESYSSRNCTAMMTVS